MHVENDPKLKSRTGLGPRSIPVVAGGVGLLDQTRRPDGKTLTLQENRAKAVIAGEKAARTPRFVKTHQRHPTLDEASLARARRLVGLKGYVTNIPADVMPAAEVIASLPRPLARRGVLPDVQDRPARPADVPPHPRRDRGPPDHRVHRPGRSSHRIRQLRPLRSATIAINGTEQTIAPAIPSDKQSLRRSGNPNYKTSTPARPLQVDKTSSPEPSTWNAFHPCCPAWREQMRGA